MFAMMEKFVRMSWRSKLRADPATLQIVPENADITNERTTTVTEATMKPDPTEEALLALDISDHALEMAAKSGLEGGACTVVFCTGLDSCPAVPAA
jgi:hypothetical protein